MANPKAASQCGPLLAARDRPRSLSGCRQRLLRQPLLRRCLRPHQRLPVERQGQRAGRRRGTHRASTATSPA
eukprot:4711477-Alexandrium_andersonii.AAC.1